MRSLRSISFIIELTGFMLIVAFLSGAVIFEQRAIRDTALSSMRSNVDNMEHAARLYLVDRTRAFTMLLPRGESEIAQAGDAYFSDLFVADEALRVRRVILKEPASLLYPGFDFSSSAAGRFLAGRLSRGVVQSPVLRSGEHVEPSIYFAGPCQGGYLVGRITIPELVDYLKSLAEALGSVVVVANRDGYVISASDPYLPLGIVPRGNTVLLPEGEAWITRRESSLLGDELLLLTPMTEVFKTLTISQSIYPWLMVALAILMTVRTVIIYRALIRPTRRLASTIEDWSVREGRLPDTAAVFGARELDTVYRKFREKAEEAAESFSLSEAARAEAELARHELEQSQQALRAMNDELESRVEARSAELRQAYDQLMRSEKLAALGALVAGVAHEVNTPLGISLTTATFLAERTRFTACAFADGSLSRGQLDDLFRQAAEGFGILENSLNRAAGLIRNFKRIAVDQNAEDLAEFDLRELLEACALSLQHEAKTGRHRIGVECPDGIGLRHYPGVFTQIVTNLAMNALIHGLRDKTEGTIRIAASVQGGGEGVRIVVEDDGAGVSEGIRDRIFEPFFTTNRAGGGSGLGLFIVHNLVNRRLGGTITLQASGALGGACFIIEAPLVPPSGGAVEETLTAES